MASHAFFQAVIALCLGFTIGRATNGDKEAQKTVRKLIGGDD